MTIQCEALSGIRYGLDGRGKTIQVPDGFSPKSSTTIIWKIGSRTASLTTGDSRNNLTTETANLINNQLDFVTWSLVNDGSTEIWTFNYRTSSLLYSSHVKQFDLIGGFAENSFFSKCRSAKN